MKKFDTNFEERDRNPSRWSRYGLPWSQTEREFLAKRFAMGAALEDICVELGRPASGVISKLCAAGLIEYSSSDGCHYVTETKPQPQPQTKEITMSNVTDITIVTRTFIGGADTTSLSDEQIFQMIARKENEIKAWESIAARPKKLQARIDAAKEEIQKLVDFVDGR